MGIAYQKNDKKGDFPQWEATITDELCERAVVTAMLNGEAYNEDTAPLTPDCFESELARAVFETIRELTAEGREVELSAVWTRSRAKGDARVDLASLKELAREPLCYDLDLKTHHLLELAARRRLLAQARELERLAVSLDRDVSSGVAKGIERLAHIDETALTNVRTLDETMEELSRLVARNMAGEGNTFSRSGFDCVDRNAMLRPEALTVIAAHSAHGKSALALSMAYNVAVAGQGVVYYSLEMSDVELTGRIAAPLCDEEPITLLYGVGGQGDLARKLEQARRKTAGVPLYFDMDATHTIDSLLGSIRQMARSRKVAGVVVDYLQILVQTLDRGKYQTEESALGAVVRQLKNLAKQEGIWILLLSQLNRNHDQEEPQESDLRGSGQILETADSCLLLWRPEKAGQRYRGELSAVDTHNTAQLRVAKARSGNDQERHILRFVADRAHFEQPAEPLPASQAQDSPASSRTFRRAKSQRKDRKGEATPPSARRPSPSSPELPFPNGGQDTTTD